MNNNKKKKTNVKGKTNNKPNRKHNREDLKEVPDPNDIGGADSKLRNHSQFGNPNWYFTDTTLAEQASRFSFQDFIGDGVLTGSALMPSILTFGLQPAIGAEIYKDSSIASVNLIARKIYAKLSNKSGRTQSYSPQDVMTLLLAMGEIVSIVAHMKRVLGVSFTYNYRNRDFPKHIISALGIDPDDLFTNLSRYRVEFNATLNLANKIPFPANLTWFQKAAAIYSGLFADSPDDMAQIYAFIPATTWIIDESSYSEGTILKTRQACYPVGSDSTEIRTFNEWIEDLNEMIEALLTSSTYDVIYGDILNLATTQDVPLMHLDLVDESYSVIPSYDAEALLHIHNMTIVTPSNIQSLVYSDDASEAKATPYNDVYPSVDNNNLFYLPKFPLPNSTELNPGDYPIIDQMTLVDFPYGNPDLTERIEATRFAIRFGRSLVEISGHGGLYLVPWSLPDHYAIGAEMYTGGTARFLPSQSKTMVPASIMSWGIVTGFEKFRYSPMIYRINDGITDVLSVSGELNYFTKLDREWCKRINDLCYQGLFEMR